MYKRKNNKYLKESILGVFFLNRIKQLLYKFAHRYNIFEYCLDMLLFVLYTIVYIDNFFNKGTKKYIFEDKRITLVYATFRGDIDIVKNVLENNKKLVKLNQETEKFPKIIDFFSKEKVIPRKHRTLTISDFSLLMSIAVYQDQKKILIITILCCPSYSPIIIPCCIYSV